MIGSAGKDVFRATQVPQPYVSYVNAYYTWVDYTGAVVNQYAGQRERLSHHQARVPYEVPRELPDAVVQNSEYSF